MRRWLRLTVRWMGSVKIEEGVGLDVEHFGKACDHRERRRYDAALDTTDIFG